MCIPGVQNVNITAKHKNTMCKINGEIFLLMETETFFVGGDCTVTWYAIRERERVKGRSIPLPLYLNQQALRLTIKMVGERRGKLSALYALSHLNEEVKVNPVA